MSADVFWHVATLLSDRGNLEELFGRRIIFTEILGRVCEAYKELELRWNEVNVKLPGWSRLCILPNDADDVAFEG